MPCPAHATEHVCAVKGSSSILTFIMKGSVHYRKINEAHYLGRKSRRFSNFKIHIDHHIFDVPYTDEGYYMCYVTSAVEVKMLVANLWFTNQTDLKTIIGEEADEMEIHCISNTEQYNTDLKIETNGTVKATGDNKSVSYLFIPDTTDHLTIYKCVDSTHSSIMIEVKLIIRFKYLST
ncbi:unnamed protein product [Mytilus coruscus]|uniref:Uncharacterized protein n=1 Tax=Mytilus coruscus TaxID=42192 RepID=A0A6J8BNC6_MYTCO|nr:unnamed protein product [Mytilus coruscus]